jgi:hypothetical protein
MSYSSRPVSGGPAEDSAVLNPEEQLKAPNFPRLRQSIRAAVGGSSRQQLALHAVRGR